MATVKGDVELMPLSDVVAWIANRQMTCTLTSRRRGKRYQFVVRGGLVFQAAATDPREYLGQHLINFGYIDEESLTKAFQTQKETDVPLGKVLVMVDAVSPEQLARVLSFKIRESLLEAMCTDFGSFKVTTDVPAARELDCEVPCDLREVHSEAQARSQMWAEIRKVFPSDAYGCEVAEVPDDLLISAFDRKLLEHLDAGKSIGQACLELRSMDFQVYARLYDLHHRDLVKPRAVEAQLAADGSYAIDDAMVLDVESDEASDSMDIAPEALDPETAMRIALAGRNWKDALLLAERILERDPANAEAQAAHRVAEVQVRRTKPKGAGSQLSRVPRLEVARGQLQQAHMTSKERYVLSRIDGRRTLKEIASVSPIEQEELLRIVEGFVARGMVKVEG